VLARDGVHAFWRKLVELMTAASEALYPAISVAVAHVMAGNTDEALTRLERIVEERSGQSVFLFVEPALAELRDTPRFQALLARLRGLRSSKVQHD
jgi:hypothetical protein